MKEKHQIIIIGGGNAGLSVASQLLIKDSSLDIALIDPVQKHYYQPAWTLVGVVLLISKQQKEMKKR